MSGKFSETKFYLFIQNFMSQEIIAVLDKIAQYLGTTSEKVLEIITRMAFVDAVIASVLIMVYTALS